MLDKLGRAVAVLGVVLAAGTAQAEVRVTERLAADQPPVIGAWRASGGGNPESTLAGIRHSLEIGADIIDIQVQRTRDGQHIVYHHARLDHATDVATVFPEGPPGGPSRAERGGLDYTRDYTLEDIRQLRLVAEGEVTEHGIPTLDEALDLVGNDTLVVLDLQEYDLDLLQAQLARRPTDHILAFSINPRVVHEVVAATGVAGYTSISQTRLFETETPLEILDVVAEILGDDLVLVHAKRARLLTPDLLARARDLGVGVSVSGYGREDFLLGEEGDPSAWLETLSSGAIVYWTTLPDDLLQVLNR